MAIAGGRRAGAVVADPLFCWSPSPAAVMLAYSSPEPYAAMITVLLPPMLVLTWSGLGARATVRAGLRWSVPSSWASRPPGATPVGSLRRVHGGADGAAAGRVAAAIRNQGGGPLCRLAVVGAIAAAIGSTTWLPYLRCGRSVTRSATPAAHYLPADGAALIFPMLQFSAGRDLSAGHAVAGDARAIIGASRRPWPSACWLLRLWSLLSMLATLARTTLLPFPSPAADAELLVAAGAFGFRQRSASGKRGRGCHSMAAAIGLAGAIVSQPGHPLTCVAAGFRLSPTPTPPTATASAATWRIARPEKYYPAIDAAIRRHRKRRDRPSC